MWAWILGCARRYAAFFLLVVGISRALSWMLGLDDEIKIWASANRPLIAVTLGLSLIVYAMYDALQERDR